MLKRQMWILIKVEAAHAEASLRAQKRSFASRVTEQEPSIFLSGNSQVRLPLLIPLTFTEQREE